MEESIWGGEADLGLRGFRFGSGGADLGLGGFRFGSGGADLGLGALWGRGTSGAHPAVPQVLRSCTEFVEQHGVVDGIYRLSGVSSNIQRLR